MLYVIIFNIVLIYIREIKLVTIISYYHVYKDNERNANTDLLVDLDIANT